MPQVHARIILLGASNVTKAISTIVETAQHLFGSPLDVYAAIGHGRSYGLRTSLFLRGLPSVLDSRIWAALREPRSMPTYALIGDIGNDVMYGPPPDLIAQWIETCFDRLGALDAKIICTGLPMARVERMSSMEYLMARTLLFPKNRFTFAEAIGRAQEVTERVAALTQDRSIPFIELPGEWYGIDPIHIRRAHWARAWGTILRHWVEADAQSEGFRARGSIPRWIRLRKATPERWWLLGMERGRPQPAATLTDGTRVSFY